ncbi:MAG: OmpA family protein, partial [Casimicrobiaceae bacterium]
LLEAHAAYLKRNPQARIVIEGNTDERGSREYNLALGQKRSESVKRVLMLLGVAEAQIEAVSFGEEKPRRTGSTEADHAENRRADIRYVGE